MPRRTEGWGLRQDRRTGNYFVRWRWGGKRYERSTRTPDRSEAQRRAARIVDDVNDGRVRRSADHRAGRPLGGIGLEALVCAWLEAMEGERKASTVELWTRYAAAHWLPYFGDDAGALTDAAKLGGYVAHRLRHVTASTVRGECSALRSFLGWCARPEVGHLDEAPIVPGPPKGAQGKTACRKVRVDLTAAQVEAIIGELPERLRTGAPCRAFFRVMWETGLRRGTMFALETPGDYRVGAMTLRVRAEVDKSAFGRELPLTSSARAALDSLAPKRGVIFARSDFRHQLAKAARAAGIEPHLAGHVSHHDFRHARTTHLIDEGAPLTGVAFLVGHRRVTTTDRYAHASTRAARVALDAVSGGGLGGESIGDTPETQKPAEVAGLENVMISTVCGREDSNLHKISLTRSLVSCVEPKTPGFGGFVGSARTNTGPPGPLTGGRPPIETELARVARRFVAALENGDVHTRARGMDLVDALADWFAVDAADDNAEGVA